MLLLLRLLGWIIVCCVVVAGLVSSSARRRRRQAFLLPASRRIRTLQWCSMEDGTGTTTATSTRQEIIMKRAYYHLVPLTQRFGAEVVGVDMSQVDLTRTDFVRQLRADLVEHRVLLFRHQNLSGQRQVDISNAFGTVESTFYQHPRSPHPDIFRVSNHCEEGCTHVGRSGWHVDGTFQPRPFVYQTMFFPSVMTEGGDTYFIPLHEFYESLPAETRERFDRLWMVTGRRRRGKEAPIVHPLVYQHPYRHKETTMLFHCGKPFVEGWFQDEEVSSHENNEDAPPSVNTKDLLPAEPIQKELTAAIESRLDDLGLRMQWQQGDFMMLDNLGLAHYASEGTQQDWRKAGLRILHRTTIRGGLETVPQKADGRRSFRENTSVFVKRVY